MRAGDVFTCKLSPQNTARWLLGHAVLRASLAYQAGRVARKFRCTVVVASDDGVELARYEPLTAPRQTAYQFHVAR